jgi:hypothetical protein
MSGPDAESNEMEISASGSVVDLQGMTSAGNLAAVGALNGTGTGTGTGARGGGAYPNQKTPVYRVKIALSLYKVQQNIYLLDFQRVEVSH